MFDVKTWGWVTLIWGIIVALTGFGLLLRGKLGAVDGDRHRQPQLHRAARLPRQRRPTPLWSLTVLGLTLVVLYALIVRWDEATAVR